jgi:hypothetical protein
MLNVPLYAMMIPQLCLEQPSKDLKQDLKTSLGDGRIIPPFAQLVADEGVLRPCELVPAEGHAGLAQFQSDQVAAPVRHVRVQHSEDERELGGDVGWRLVLPEEVEGVL